ncbi:MAG: TIGR02996 domain-containing protein [Polyangiaceae bacterium]
MAETETPGRWLAEAQRRFDAGHEDDALDAMIAAWRMLRAVELADLVERASLRLTPHAPALDGNLETFQPAWLSLARGGRSAHLPALLRTALHTTHRFGVAIVEALVARGQVLARWPADPRSAALVVAHLSKGGYESTSKSTWPFWQSLLSMVDAHDDPRAVELLRPLRFARVFRSFSDGKRRIEWFQREVDALTGALAARHPHGPPKLPKDLAPAVEKLRAALDGRKEVSPEVRARIGAAHEPPVVAKGAPAKARALSKSPPSAVVKHLDLAARAATDEARLAALLDAWRLTRAEEIASLVDRTSQRIAARLPAIRGANRKATHAAWLRVAKQDDPADLPRLLSSITDTLGRSTDALARVQALASRPADPRTGGYVAALLEVPPFFSSSANKFWAALLGLAAKHGDARAAPRLGAVAKRYDLILADPYSDRSAQVSWFRRQIQATIDAVTTADTSPLDAPAKAACEAVAAALGEVEDGLLEAIFRDVDDDAPRHVYADRLQERGDPRGEFIALSLSGRMPARIQELREKYAYTWVGGLWPFVVLDACELERGFLSHVELSGLEPERLASVADDPVWATVRTLHLGLSEAPKKRFVASRTMSSLTGVTYQRRSGRRALEIVRAPA